MDTATTLKVTGSGNSKVPVKSEISVADLFKLERQTAMTTQLTAITIPPQRLTMPPLILHKLRRGDLSYP